MNLSISDSLNPMLVRDLRQGLRSNRFTIVFLLLHLCMAFFVTMGLLSGQGSEVGHTLTHSLIIAFILFYLLGLPMAASFAFLPEFSENRLDLLKLTQMPARKLVWGKWLSLFLQGLMVFFSLLPYLILTYFFGQVDLTKELFQLAVILGLSALLVGAGVAVSCFRHWVCQVLVILGLLWITYYAIQTATELQNTGFTFDSDDRSMQLLSYLWENYGIVGWLYITLAAPALWIVLEFGAARLAPASENHDTPQRLVLLALVAVSGLVMALDIVFVGSFMEEFTNQFLPLAAGLGIVILMFSACAEPSPYPETYRPFVRFGVFGRFLGRAFLYPGWPSATFFTLLVTTFASMLSKAWYDLHQLQPSDTWLIPYLLLPPAVLFPQLAGWLIFGRTRLSSGARYFLIVALGMLLYVVGMASFGVTNSKACIIAAGVLPQNSWLLFLTDRTRSALEDLQILQTMKIIAASIGGLTLALMCLRSLWHWRKTQQLERRAADTLRRRRPTDATSPPAPGAKV